MEISKRDVLELRRRLTKKGCSFQQMAGCYVNGEKEILLEFTESFTDLSEDEFFKYLEIAKKALSGTLGSNLLDLEFDRGQEADERQRFLLTLKSSKLKNPDLLRRFYEQVIAQYDNPGNYLILVFHDIYDVITRAKDRAKLDESEEVYEYIICAMWPVELSKPGLGYREEENRIGLRERDWVVGLPEIGFLYPSFRNRGSDVNALLYYIKNGKEIHPTFVEQALGCQTKRTAYEEKQTFQEIVQDAFGTQSDQADAAFVALQRNLNGLIEVEERGESPLTTSEVSGLLEDVEMPQEVREQIERDYQQTFGDALPAAGHLLDRKLAEEGMRRAQTMELQSQIVSLQQQLQQTQAEGALPDRILQLVPSERRGQVRTQMLDGQRYLLIPLADGETMAADGAAQAEPAPASDDRVPWD